MVKPEEFQHWLQVPLDAMSSESELEDDSDTLVRHSPSWRSECENTLICARRLLYNSSTALEKFVSKLDRRAADKESKSKKKPPLNKKIRIRGAPVEHPILPGLKQWMVKKGNGSFVHV